jgi:type II secretory pathway component GspD/PulD (secretin)
MIDTVCKFRGLRRGRGFLMSVGLLVIAGNLYAASPATTEPAATAPAATAPATTAPATTAPATVTAAPVVTATTRPATVVRVTTSPVVPAGFAPAPAASSAAVPASSPSVTSILPASLTASGAAKPSAKKRVTNLWVDTDLRQVIQDIASQTDTVIVCDQTVGGLVSMSVKDMSLEDCLERACAAGGYTYMPIKDYYLVGKADPGSMLFQRLADPQRVKLSYIQPDQVRGLLHSSMAPFVTFDKVGGSLVVTAPEPLRQRILDAIKQIDVPNRQVAIEAVVFELTEDGSKQLAMDWKFQTPNFSASSSNLINTFSYGANSDLGVLVDVTLRAIVASRKGQVLANPRIMVTNNNEAEIFVGQEKYFTLLSGQSSNPYYTLQSIKAGVTLKVLPYIGDNGQITLDLEPEVSDVATDSTQTPGSPQQAANTAPMPVVTRRHAKTVVNIKDGQTVLIGGLLMDQHLSEIAKVPGVGDVPVAGAPFRAVNSQRTQQEVVILITAHLADDKGTPKESLTPRLTRRYVSPLDAIATPLSDSRRSH